MITCWNCGAEIDPSSIEVQDAVMQEIGRKQEEKRIERNSRRAYAQSLKDKMTTEEKIQFLSTPYKNMPKELQEGMVKWPQMFNFVRYSHPRIGRQRELFSVRLIKFREKYGLSQQDFCNLCNTFAAKFDLPADETHRAQRTRITMNDIRNYENNNVCPKIDKMTVIAEAMQVTITYFAGYGPGEASSRNEVLQARFRKKRGGAAA